jgi:DegV family protein with EDD domain
MAKRKFQIITDTGCDMPENYYKEHGVLVARLGFTMNNVNYEGVDGERIDVKEFYGKLRDGAMPTTYQITGETAATYIEDSFRAGNDVLVLTFSSGLSGTAGSFQLAARGLSKQYKNRKVIVVDSLCASMGQGLLLDYIIKKADEGASLEETAQYAEDLKLHICHQFTVDNLFHLKRGGRVSSATAIVGTILKIKPVLHVDDAGHLVAVVKAMGRKKALHTLVERMLAAKDITEQDPIFISHGDCIEDVEYVKSLLQEHFPKNPVFVHYIGPVIGTHSGAGTVALFHKGTHR